MRKKDIIFLAALLSTLFLSVFSLGFGVINVPFVETLEILKDIVMGIGDTGNVNRDLIEYIRLPHMVLAFIIGSGLAACGAGMQAVLKNPLADPYLLGISSGAGLGAVLALVSGIGGLFGSSYVGICAFTGAISATLIVLLISSIVGKSNKLYILLVGIAVNAACSAIMSFIISYLDDKNTTRSIQFWLLGSLEFNDWQLIGCLALLIFAGILYYMSQARILDLMVVGDELALTMGRDLSVYRKRYILISAIMVGAMVFVSGMIGFIGLLIPHAVRLITGSNHKRLIPLSALTGGCFLIWADILGRNIMPGTVVPIGAMAALAGAPLFIWMLLSGRYGDAT